MTRRRASGPASGHSWRMKPDIRVVSQTDSIPYAELAHSDGLAGRCAAASSFSAIQA